MKTRVMVVDDHASFRQMLGAILPREGAFEMVAEAATGLEAIRMHEESKPQLVVLDLALPELSGVGLLQHLRERARETRTLVFCGTNNREIILEALRNRPHGFVMKKDPFSVFREALRMVTAGCSYVAPYATQLMDHAGAPTAPPQLTARERTVMQMLAESKSNKEIAGRLGISPKTVEHHRSRIMEKLGVHDIAGLTRYAVRQGLVAVE